MRFVFDPPVDYWGPTYVGDLCAFCPLGNEQNRPFAASGGKFFLLWQQATGALTRPTLTTEELQQVFVGRLFEIEVTLVKVDRKQRDLPQSQWYSIVRRLSLASQDAKGLGAVDYTHENSEPRGGTEAAVTVPRSQRIRTRKKVI
jgi:hypothetical protein